MTLKRLCLSFLPLFLLAVVSGCETVHYEYKAPSSPEGRQCVVQCASVREQCRSNEGQRVQAEKRACERRAELAHYACLDRAHGKEQRRKCDAERGSCYVWANFDRCEDEYRQCFSYCGGEVKKVVSK